LFKHCFAQPCRQRVGTEFNDSAGELFESSAAQVHTLLFTACLKPAKLEHLCQQQREIDKSQKNNNSNKNNTTTTTTTTTTTPKTTTTTTITTKQPLQQHACDQM